MNADRADADAVNFGELDPKTNELLQQGVVAYRTDREKADSLFKQALALTPEELAPYYCLYKIHTYMGSLDYAADVAAEGMKQASRQAGWPSDPAAWPAQVDAQEGPARFALYTLKALSFIELKRGHSETAKEYLDILSRADPQGSVGWKVIEELAQGSAP
jgi:tetratricopeptide (TPR) repeat protein